MVFRTDTFCYLGLDHLTFEGCVGDLVEAWVFQPFHAIGIFFLETCLTFFLRVTCFFPLTECEYPGRIYFFQNPHPPPPLPSHHPKGKWSSPSRFKVHETISCVAICRQYMHLLTFIVYYTEARLELFLLLVYKIKDFFFWAVFYISISTMVKCCYYF